MNSPSLAHYRVLHRLGSGGMGEVHLAEDLHLGRKVALKTLPPDLQSNEESKRRLLREARAAARLDHPNVATIYEVGEADGQSYIAMQFVEGETLANRIARSSLSAAEIRSISCDVLSALGAAHEKQLIHRDIKPQNIMITADGRAIVLDFGLARVTGSAAADANLSDVALTEAGVICGTLSYMSPEQLRGESLDGRTDLFSFGVVLYEMVTGRRPFDSGSGASTIAAILFAAPPMLPLESSGFHRIAERSLQKARDARYATASDMLAELRGAGSSSRSAADVPTTRLQEQSGTAPTQRLSWTRSAPVIDDRARDLYDKARLQWNKRTPPAFQMAIDLFQEAIEVSPGFALAYAGLADCYNYLAFFDALAASDVMLKARTAATKAIELDGTLAEPHTSLGFTDWTLGWEWDAGERHLLRAMELNPSYALAPHWYSILLSVDGRFDEACAFAERAFALDPLNPIISTGLGFPWLFSRRYEEALARFQKTAATDSRFPPIHYYLGITLEQLGESADAIAAFDRLDSLLPEGRPFNAPSLAHCHAAAGNRDRATEMLGELKTLARRRYISPFGLTLIHVGLGDLDSAFVELRAAFEHHAPRLYTIAADARFDSLVKDPRYESIAEEYHLPAAMRARKI